MEKVFDTLIDSFLENKVGIQENFIPNSLLLNLRNNILELQNQGKLKRAGTGSNSNKNALTNVRGDQICWLERTHNNASENQFLDILDTFIEYLNTTCYTGIKSYEFHYTLYEKGTYYHKHLDQFTNKDSRKYSLIVYLNENWQKNDGGELAVELDQETYKITPTMGKCVFFKSNEIPHAVLTTQKNRLSITGWLKT